MNERASILDAIEWSRVRSLAVAATVATVTYAVLQSVLGRTPDRYKKD